MSKVVIAVLAHPDDAEFLCAGTLTRLTREHGWAVHIATMTAGDCGSSHQPPDVIAGIRRKEGAAAAGVIGATYHCLEERDMRVLYSEPALDKVADLLCLVRADVVITHSPDDYHPDHEATSKLVRTATFAAPIPNFQFARAKHPPLDRIPHVFYCDPLEGKDIFGREIAPLFCVDISGQIDVKEKMLASHASQRDWLMKHHGVDNYLISMRDWSEKQGRRIGTRYAEGFRQHLGHSYPQDNIIGALLGGK